MTTPFVRAGADWLVLREPADAGARSHELVEALLPHLPPEGLVVHDLGCGTGSMARWLSPRLGGPQHWILHDRDAELLTLAQARPPARSPRGRVTVETRLDDITRLSPTALDGASLLTASALLDMFTAEELERFVAVCVRARCPVLVTLSVVGRVELGPGDQLDGRVLAAFNGHQRRRTDHGRLLGPSAAAAAARAFRRHGLEVLERPSPWRLGPEMEALATQWFDGWVGAAREQQPELQEAMRPYAARRLDEIASGRLSVTVHHTDLLALPPPAGRAARP